MALTREEKKLLRLAKSGAAEELKKGVLTPAKARRLLRRIIRTADELLTPGKKKK